MRTLIVMAVSAMFLAACSPNNVTDDNSLQKYFDENKVTGCFGLFDNALGRFTMYNRKRLRDSVYLPASTFKIVNSLIGIETGRVNDEKSIIPWDGQVRSRVDCNKDLSMIDAFHLSCVPWYQELARRIGKDTMQRWLDTLGYASRNGRAVIDSIDRFWLNNNIKITADEQLGMVKKLYFDQLPFQKRTQRIVCNMMLMEDNSNYKLSYKTGWGFTENNHSIGWVVGWIEENKHPYFFVLQIENQDRNADIIAPRMNILKGILKQLGFMEGKK